MRLGQGIFGQADPPASPHDIRQSILAVVAHDRLPHFSGDDDRLVDADPPPVPGVLALVASDRFERHVRARRTRGVQGWRGGPTARGAQPPHQPLHDDANERAGNRGGIRDRALPGPQIPDGRSSARTVVITSPRAAAERASVARLDLAKGADDHDVWSLLKDRPKSGGAILAARTVDRGLSHAGNLGTRIGSSIETMSFRPERTAATSAASAASVAWTPLPAGPMMRTRPRLCAPNPRTSSSIVFDSPRSLSEGAAAGRSHRRSTTFSPKSVRRLETRNSVSGPSPTAHRSRPSWGNRVSVTRIPASRLSAPMSAVGLACGQRGDVTEHAVHPFADGHALCGRLDVDVGGAARDGARQDGAQRVLDPGLRDGRRRRVLLNAGFRRARACFCQRQQWRRVCRCGWPQPAGW